MTTSLHAHISTSQRDCDGPTYDEWVVGFNDEEKAEHEAGEARGYNDFSDIHFHNRIVADTVNSYSLLFEGTLNVTKSEDGTTRMVWSEPTDEGHRSREVTFCTDDCDLGEKSHRDVFAEQMGY